MRVLHTDRHYDVTYIPINQELEATSDVLPRQVVYEMVERASHMFLLSTSASAGWAAAYVCPFARVAQSR